MRIIAGQLGGRQFDSPGTFRTHPMSDKMRGALFNILGDIEGLKVLDAFSGSGAISFEAISRGAASVLAIESDTTAQKVIGRNSVALGVAGQVHLVKASVGSWLSSDHTNDLFDIVICDPPYNDLQPALISRLAVRVSKDGLLVLSWPKGEEVPRIGGLIEVERRSYGDAQLVFYRKTD